VAARIAANVVRYIDVNIVILFTLCFIFILPNTAMAKVNENKSAKKHSAFVLTQKTKVAIGLEALGVAAVGYGIYQNSRMNSYLDKAKIYNRIDPKYRRAADAHSARNISYIAGSALLASGVVVYISF